MNQQSNVNKFLEFNTGMILDLSSVIKVNPIGGDPSQLRYTVHLSNGTHFKIYEDRNEELCMPREKFLEALKKYYGINWLQTAKTNDYL